MTAKVTSDTTRLNNLIRHSDRNNRRFLKAIGFSVEGKAKIKAPKDLGNLTNSIYTQTSEDPVTLPFLQDELEREELPQPPKDSVYVGPSVEYGIYQELGTTLMDAQPYMLPALREVENELRSNSSIAKGLIDE